MPSSTLSGLPRKEPSLPNAQHDRPARTPRPAGTPGAQPPHQSNVFEEGGGGLEGEGETF